MNTEKVYELKITLKESKPSIWRRVLVNSEVLLPNLHIIIQTTMGWDNTHLHHFIDKRTIYSKPDEDDEIPSVDYGDITLDMLLIKEKDSIDYEYDFGDCWEHEITLEKILNKEVGKAYPECIDGENSCPPEDCGGIWRYEELLEIISNPKHEEYDEMMEWLGKDFDPGEFNKEEVNELLGSEGDNY